MSNLYQSLYITYSNQRARDLKSGSLTQPLDRVITLEQLITDTFEKSHFAYIIDATIGTSIIYRLIREHKIDYFAYLKSDAESLQTIFDFLLKCKRNDVAFSSLLEGEKLEAISKIATLYEAYKQTHHLADMADVERTVLAEWGRECLSAYDEVYVDDFKVGEIDFAASKMQASLLALLAEYPSIPLEPKEKGTARLIRPSNTVFDAMDEVRTALKIARKLLEEGESAEEILIVASDIAEYAPLYKLFLSEYGLQGYTSVGTPLSSFHAVNDPRVKRALEEYRIKVQSMTALYDKLGLQMNDTIKEKLKASVKILDEKRGIEMTEPNQLVGLNRGYKHIIFIGTDINHFPPQAKDNFLYRYEDDISHFQANDYFLSSQTQLDELKRLSENLYIVTATHSGKRELMPSILLDGRFDDTIEIEDIKSVSELALEQKTTLPDENTKAYYDSIVSEHFTVFDGKGVEGVRAEHLSASQINRYLSCPLAYLYTYKLKLKAPRQSEEGFDVMEQGSLMHLCYELFGRKIRDEKIRSLDRELLCNLMYEVSLEAYDHEETSRNRGEENIHHRIFLSTLQAGLKDEREAGVLAKFVDYYIENAKELEYFQNTEFEKAFALDRDLKPYTIKGEDDYGYFIRGFIDRFDNLPERINVIDYKSKKIGTKSGKHKETQAKIDELKDVQLALYLLYAKQQYSKQSYYASLLSFKGDHKAAHYGELTDEQFDEAYEAKLKEIVFATKEGIEKGEFGFDSSDEDVCKWCDYKRICHQEVLAKAQMMRLEEENVSENDTIKV